MIVAGLAQALAGEFVGVGHGVVGGDGRGGVARAAGEQFPAEAAAFVDLEEIDGDVLGAEAQGLVEGVAPACGRSDTAGRR